MSSNEITLIPNSNTISISATGLKGLKGNPGTGGATWGGIVGTLSDQADLQATFDTKTDKVPAVIPISEKSDFPAPVAGVITLSTTNVRYKIYGSINLGTDRIDVTAANVQIEGKTPDAGFFYSGTDVLISTTQTLQQFDLNLIGFSATRILDAVDDSTSTLVCNRTAFVGGPTTELVCIDSYANVLFELCGFVSGSRGILLSNAITNFTVNFCQFQIGVTGANIDYNGAICAATAISTCVSELSPTSTFIVAAANNGNITADGGGTITNNKINNAAIGSVVSVGLSPLDLRWLFIGNNKLTTSDRVSPTGWSFYVDGDTVPQSAVAGVGNAIKFSVDGLDAASNSDFAPQAIRGVTEMWDTSINEMIPITLGDSFSLRIAFTLTAKTANPSILTVVFDIGGAAGITIPVYTTSIATPNTFPQMITLVAPIFALDAFLANNGQVFMYTDAGTLTVRARAVMIQRISSGAS